MIRLPLSWVQILVTLGLFQRPDFLAVDVEESPDDLAPGFVFREVRGGYEKWLHLKCPRCGEHIQIPLAGNQRWSISIDWLNRPTVNPSIWQTGSCQAHFFVRKGGIDWCPDPSSSRRGFSGRYA
jgi:hypothetical protein